MFFEKYTIADDIECLVGAIVAQQKTTLCVQTEILWHECYLEYDEFVFVDGEVRGVDFETVSVQFEVFVGGLKTTEKTRRKVILKIKSVL